MSSVHDSHLALRLEQLVNSTQSDRAPLPSVGWDSTEPLPPLARTDAGLPASQPPTAHTGKLWLDGGVLMCGCPDCRAPMTVRLWLMVADCWQCGTSIELTEELIREAERLLADRAEAENSINVPAPVPANPPPSTRPAVPRPPAQRPHTVPARPRTRRASSPAPPASTPIRSPAGAKRTTGVTAWLDELFDQTPAWLVSLIFHLILLTVLGLLTWGQPEDDVITLSTTVNKWVEEGGEILPTNPQDEIVYDLLPQDVDLDDPRQRQAVLRAEQDARQLRLDPNVVEPDLPNLDQVKSLVASGRGPQSALAARDPRIRIEMLKREGGTTLTEAAVARGLSWLAEHQQPDGSWSLDQFNRLPGCNCNSGGVHSDSAGTSLALLPFLGAGQTHLVGTYQQTVSHGLRWLLDHQDADGDLRLDSSGNTGMYAHGQGAIVLCEAYYMTGDQRLREPAQRAIDFIAAAQHPAGGWRYAPGMEGDTSVLGWQLMALQSARAANLRVPEETLELAGHFLDRVGYRGGSIYGYMPRKVPDQVMTAEALLCRAYLGWTSATPGFVGGIDFLTERFLPDADASNFYYWYYGTQLMHHVGGTQWELWNHRIREILVATQRKRGHAAGSWDPIDPHDRAGGRLYATAMATCTLEVYYRHLPLFRQIELD